MCSATYKKAGLRRLREANYNKLWPSVITLNLVYLLLPARLIHGWVYMNSMTQRNSEGHKPGYYHQNTAANDQPGLCRVCHLAAAHVIGVIAIIFYIGRIGKHLSFSHKWTCEV